MKLERHARRLTVFVGEEDAYDHKPRATEIVHRAHKAGLAGRPCCGRSKASVHRTTCTTRIRR